MKDGQGVEGHHEAMDQDVELKPELWENVPPDLIDKIVEEVLITESPVLLRTEEMKEGQGVEEHHEAMDQDVELNPELWANLPFDLIDIIVEKVLLTLPFSRVLSFCSVCKRWTDFLLSMEYLLFFHNLSECMVFNPRTGLWGSMPLLFSEADVLKLQNMELVSCGGGLLYFASAGMDEFIVCNPLTRRCSTLSGPDAARRIWNAEHMMARSYPSGWRIAFSEVWYPLPFSTKEIILKISAASDTELFDLYLFKTYRYGSPSVTLTMKDSRLSYYVRVPDVHRDFCFVVLPTFVWSEASVMLGFYACAGGFNVLFYDAEEQRCHWGLNVCSLEHELATNRKTLLATMNGGGQWDFLELRDGRLTLGRAPFPPPTEVLRKNAFFRVLPDLTATLELSEILNFVHVEQGDIVYYISLFRQFPGGQVNISVWTRNLVNGLERISNWVEWRTSAWESHELPSSKNFLAFKPSFESP